MKSAEIMALLTANASADAPSNIDEKVWPEIRLWRAVVLVALADLASRDRLLQSAAEEWIYGLPSTFAAICDMAALDSKKIRRVGGVILDGGDINAEDAKARAGGGSESVRDVRWLSGYEQYGRIVETLEGLALFDDGPVVPDMRGARAVPGEATGPAPAAKRAD